ncbi:diguanylate cyclase [Psychrobacillus sp. NPDC058041]|uniref:sensor domain-containing diguanylate cyclase n=1 Tax=Psychrobacillus sp. NPDC058041 TaxID=3346310 RepID=UPI0036D7A6D8
MDKRLKEAPCGYVSITKQGMIIEMNQNLLETVGYAQEDLMHTHIEDIMSITNKLLFHTYFYPFIQLNGHVEEMYLSLKDSKGQDVPVLLNAKSFIRDGMEVIDCVFMQMGKRIDYEQEIRFAKKQMEEALREKNNALIKLEQLHMEVEQKQKQLIQLNAKLEKHAITDSLTGLKNRRFFLEKLKEQMDLFERTNCSFSLLIVDIDFFKKVNDTWGHQVGDSVLVKVAEIMESLVEDEKDEMVARYGGEEFVLLLPQTNKKEAKEKAEKLRNAVQNAEWEISKITISIGVTTSILGDSDTTIIAKADRALYISKEKGRNRMTYLEEMLQEE